MITKESIVTSLITNNYEIEFLEKFSGQLSSQVNLIRTISEIMQKNSWQLPEVLQKLPTYNTFSRFIKFYFYDSNKDIKSNDFKINYNEVKKHVKRDVFPYYANNAKPESDKWESTLVFFEKKLAFIQSRLENLRMENIKFEKALSDLKDGITIEEVERFLEEPSKIIEKKIENEEKSENATVNQDELINNNKENVKELELKKTGWGELRPAIDHYVKEYKLGKGKTVPKKVREEIYEKIKNEWKLNTTLQSVGTELREAGYCKKHQT